MALGGVVPGLVMAFVGFDQTNEVSQSPFAEQGILWLVAVIPALDVYKRQLGNTVCFTMG